MAKFLSYYNLCSIHDPKEFLGLSSDGEEGNIIITAGKNIVQVFKLSSQKIVNNWSTQEKLSLKVVFDKKSQKYVGVFGGRYIRCWDANVIEINKMKKIKFQKEILDIISSDLIPEVLLLYHDGTCEFLSSGIESRKTATDISQSSTFDMQHYTVVNPNIFSLRDGRKQLTYFLKNNKNNTVELITTYLNEEDLKSLNPIKYPISRNGVDLVGYTVVEGQNYPSILTVWSDKRIFMMSLKDDTSPTDMPGNFVSLLSSFDVNNPISVIGISAQYVAIYGASNIQEGASLVLFNTQFKVVNAKQYFKIYFNISQLWVVNNHILLAMGQNLCVVTYVISKEYLCELIGTQVTAIDYKTKISCDLINEEEDLEQALLFNQNQPDENCRKALRVPLSKGKTNNFVRADGKEIPFEAYEEFEKNYRFMTNYNVTKNLQVEIITTNAIDNENDIQIQLMTNPNDSGYETKEIFQLAKELEQSGSSEQEITEKILFLLINTQNIDDIITCIRRYTYVSERSLIDTLKYALKGLIIENDNVNNDEYSGTKIFGGKLIDVKRFELINVILSCSFDVENISTYVRKEFDFNEILILIEHLYNIFTNPEKFLEERPDTSFDFDEELLIIKWFSLILNTHFQHLALSHDVTVVNLLTKWCEEIHSFQNDLQNLSELSNLLYRLVEGKLEQKCTYSKWYSIEEVELY